MTAHCRPRPVMLSARLLAFAYALAFALAFVPATAHAQQHAPAGTSATQGPPENPAGHTGPEAEHGGGGVSLVAKLVNFAALAWILFYFLKAPLATYLESRGVDIRQELVTADEMRREATTRLEEIAEKLKSLPAELETLQARGAEDVRLERIRLSDAITAERDRLLEHMRREIEMRLRIARRELVEHAARLAVQVAENRIKGAITPEDHLRLMDRYTTQVEEAR